MYNGVTQCSWVERSLHIASQESASWFLLVNSPSPCGYGVWSPAAPWLSGNDCAPCRRRGFQSRCRHHRWAEESGAWLQSQTQMARGQGSKLTTGQTDTHRETSWSWQKQVGSKTDTQADNWAQRERELKGERRLTLDLNPHRCTPLIGVLPPSVSLINLRESDSLSISVLFIFQSAFCWQVASPTLIEISPYLTTGSQGVKPEGSVLYSHAPLPPHIPATCKNSPASGWQIERHLKHFGPIIFKKRNGLKIRTFIF